MSERKYYAIYSRKSKFTGKGESIDNQIELCRSFLESTGKCALSDIIVFEDEGFSGGNVLRPKFQEMMKRARERKLEAVVCYRLDRVSRNIGDFARLIDELSGLECSFISIKEQFDTQTPMGRAMMYIASVFSQLERETAAERIKDNLLELAKTGRWLGGITPTGYESQAVEFLENGRKKRHHVLKLLPVEEETVRLIFQKFLSSKSLKETVSFLNITAVKTKTRKPFTTLSVKDILKNPVYCPADQNAYAYFDSLSYDIFGEKEKFDGHGGLMAYNKTRQQKGKTNAVRSPEEWIIAVGAHTPIVSSSDWIAAQKLLSSPSKTRLKNPINDYALLSSILFCQSCNSSMRAKRTGQALNGCPPNFSYVCKTKGYSKGKNCQTKNLNGKTADEAVIRALSSLPFDEEFFLSALKFELLSSDNSSGHSIETKALKKNLAEIKSQIENLLSSLALSSDKNTKALLLEHVASLNKKKEELLKSLDLLRQTPLTCSGEDFSNNLNPSSKMPPPRITDEPSNDLSPLSQAPPSRRGGKPLKNLSNAPQSHASLDTMLNQTHLLSFPSFFESLSLLEKRSFLCSLSVKFLWDGNLAKIQPQEMYCK